MSIPFQDQDKLKAYCEPFIRGDKLPATAAELMASRYVAYASRNVDYIIATHDPDTREDTDREATEEWAKAADFRALEIVSTTAGGPNDDSGEVEFIARYLADGREVVHHERSSFRRVDGRWFFSEGKQLQIPVRRSEPKLGRNDPCSCGSGKKYKKCHGAR